MQKRIESSPNKIPLNKAAEIYNLSRYTHILAKMRYNLAYKSWAEFIKNNDLKVQLDLENEEIPFKNKRRKK